MQGGRAIENSILKKLKWWIPIDACANTQRSPGCTNQGRFSHLKYIRCTREKRFVPCLTIFVLRISRSENLGNKSLILPLIHLKAAPYSYARET